MSQLNDWFIYYVYGTIIGVLLVSFAAVCNGSVQPNGEWSISFVDRLPYGLCMVIGGLAVGRIIHIWKENGNEGV